MQICDGRLRTGAYLSLLDDCATAEHEHEAKRNANGAARSPWGMIYGQN